MHKMHLSGNLEIGRMAKSDKPYRFQYRPKKQTAFDFCAEQIRALAEPQRLKLVCVLFDGPQNVTQLCESIGTSIVNTSHHLGVLNDAGIVQRKRAGKNIIHSLNPTVVELKSRVVNLGYCRIAFTAGKPKLSVGSLTYP